MKQSRRGQGQTKSAQPLTEAFFYGKFALHFVVRHHIALGKLVRHQAAPGQLVQHQGVLGGLVQHQGVLGGLLRHQSGGGFTGLPPNVSASAASAVAARRSVLGPCPLSGGYLRPCMRPCGGLGSCRRCCGGLGALFDQFSGLVRPAPTRRAVPIVFPTWRLGQLGPW